MCTSQDPDRYRALNCFAPNFDNYSIEMIPIYFIISIKNIRGQIIQGYIDLGNDLRDTQLYWNKHKSTPVYRCSNTVHNVPSTGSGIRNGTEYRINNEQ